MENKVEEWKRLKSQLRELQDKERTLRVHIAKEILGDKREGSKSGEFEGVAFTATGVLSYRVDATELAILEEDLTEQERECIRYKPEVVLTKYRKLEGSNLSRAITVTEGLPQLKEK